MKLPSEYVEVKRLYTSQLHTYQSQADIVSLCLPRSSIASKSTPTLHPAAFPSLRSSLCILKLHRAATATAARQKGMREVDFLRNLAYHTGELRNRFPRITAVEPPTSPPLSPPSDRKKKIFWFVTQAIHGCSFQDVLDYVENSGTQVPEELCWHIGIQVAEVLRCLHDRGAIYDDLHTKNIILSYSRSPATSSRDSDDGAAAFPTVVLIDFTSHEHWKENRPSDPSLLGKWVEKEAWMFQQILDELTKLRMCGAEGDDLGAHSHCGHSGGWLEFRRVVRAELEMMDKWGIGQQSMRTVDEVTESWWEDAVRARDRAGDQVKQKVRELVRNAGGETIVTDVEIERAVKEWSN